MIALLRSTRDRVEVVVPVVVCDVCGDGDAVHAFTVTDPGVSVVRTNVCVFCMDVATKGFARLVARCPALLVSVGGVA